MGRNLYLMEYSLGLRMYVVLRLLVHSDNADILQSHVLFRACLIYAHTSMFLNHLRDPRLDFDISFLKTFKHVAARMK
jgi:hypothetical protein